MRSFRPVSRKPKPPPPPKPPLIELIGPSLDQRVLATGRSLRKPSRPNDFHGILLSPHGPAKSHGGGSAPKWYLKVKETLGKHRDDPVVEILRCQAFPAKWDPSKPHPRVSVVLKLYPKSEAEKDPFRAGIVAIGKFDPEYQRLMEEYHSGASQIDRVGMVFRKLNHLQGCELEYCWGIYNIRRYNKSYVGVLVEDLSKACSLEEAVEDIQKWRNHKEASRDLSEMMLAANRTHKLFVEHDLALQHSNLHDLLHFTAPSKDTIKSKHRYSPVVAVGFGRVASKSELEANLEAEKESRRLRGMPPFDEDETWHESDDYSLGACFQNCFENFESPVWKGSEVARAFEENDAIPDT